jgi:hypothetical protein
MNEYLKVFAQIAQIAHLVVLFNPGSIACFIPAFLSTLIECE